MHKCASTYARNILLDVGEVVVERGNVSFREGRITFSDNEVVQRCGSNSNEFPFPLSHTDPPPPPPPSLARKNFYANTDRSFLVPSFLSFRLRGPWLLLSIYRHRHLDNEVYVSTLFFSSRDDKLDGEGRKKGDGRVATLVPRLDGPRYR